MANKEHVKKFKAGPEAWNYWRRNNPSIIPDLSGAKLSGRNIDHMDLSGVNLTNANLSRVRGTHVDFTGTIANGAKFDKAQLGEDSRFEGTMLVGASFKNATLHNVTFDMMRNFSNPEQKSAPNHNRTDASYADFSNAKITNSKIGMNVMHDLNLRHANFIGTTFGLTNFSGSDLSQANFSNNQSLSKVKFTPETILNHVDFTRANLSGCSLEGLKLQGAHFEDTNLQFVSFAGTDLSGATLKVSTPELLKGTSFRGANLQGLVADRSNLKGISFSEADLGGASFIGTNQRGGHFSDAAITNSMFTGADLSAATLRGTEGPGTNFAGAYLEGARLDGGQFQNAVFDGAKATGMSAQTTDLSGACMTRTELGNSDLRGANVAGTEFMGANLTGANATDLKDDITTAYTGAKLPDNSTHTPHPLNPTANLAAAGTLPSRIAAIGTPTSLRNIVRTVVERIKPSSSTSTDNHKVNTRTQHLR